MLLEMADSAVLPFKLENFPKVLKENMELLEKNDIARKMEENNASLKFASEAIDEFEEATLDFVKEIEKVKERKNPLELRMMHLERIFLLPRGVNQNE